MTEIRYRPGRWFGVVSGAGMALLPDALSEEAVKAVVASFEEGRGLAGVLETLTAVFGVGLTSLPPFAVVALDGDSARLAVRGDLLVEVVEGPDEQAPPTALSGEGVTTWNERLITGPVSISVRQKSARRGSPLSLPIGSGVVLCSRLTATFRGATVEARPVGGESTGAEEEPGIEEAAERVPEAAVAVAAVVAPVVEVPVVEEPVAAPPPLDVPVEAAPVESVPVVEVPEEPRPAPEPEVAAPPVAEVVPAPLEADPVTAGPVAAPIAVDDSDELDEWGYPRAQAEAPTPAPVPAPNPAPADETLAHDQTRIPLSETVRGADEEYDHLFGATVARVVEDAAVRATGEPAMIAAVPLTTAPVAPAVPDDGDHDGRTVSIAELRRRQAAAPAAHAAPAAPAPAVPIARLEFSTGEVVGLDRPVVIGRRPQAGRASAVDLPHLITVPSPQQDISRSHLEVRAEGRDVVVRDLASVNGTVLHRTGRPPVRLSGSEAVVVVGGDVLDLGDGVRVTVREQS